MQQPQFSATGQKLYDLLAHTPTTTTHLEETVAVTGVAGGVYYAYEKLRNATQATQQNLLLRSAIERYLRRAVYLPSPSRTAIAEDLIIDLTQSRYIKNNSVPRIAVTEINRLVKLYADLYEPLTTVQGVSPSKATAWIYQVLSVLVEQKVSPQPVTERLVEIVYDHYKQAIDRTAFGDIDDATFGLILYCAVHRTLFTADIATTRTHWMLIHPEVPFKDLCETIDRLFEHRLTNRLGRIISRFGGPMRVINELVASDGLTPALLRDRQQLRIYLDTNINYLYESMIRTTVQNLWRMVIFILITKMIIGIGIEVPYDIIALGSLAFIPLAINLLFPPLYMMSAAVSVRKPSRENTAQLVTNIDHILYASDNPVKYLIPRNNHSKNTTQFFNIIYAVTFLVPLGLTVWLLAQLGFGLVHGTIFFVFFSAVSVLRFRVLQATREYDVIDRPHTLLNVAADFFYLPFVRLGNWLSDRYQKINIVAFLLDMLIEMPLKTSLRFLRQWVSFMREKRDEL